MRNRFICFFFSYEIVFDRNEQLVVDVVYNVCSSHFCTNLVGRHSNILDCQVFATSIIKNELRSVFLFDNLLIFENISMVDNLLHSRDRLRDRRLHHHYHHRKVYDHIHCPCIDQ